MVQSVQVEKRRASSGPALLIDITHHLRERAHLGQVLIIADRPIVFLSNMRKHWLYMGRKVQRERASTLDVNKIAAANAELEYLYGTRFSTTGAKNTDVRVMTPQELETPSNLTFQTLYLCATLDKKHLELATARLENGGLSVDYADNDLAA